MPTCFHCKTESDAAHYDRVVHNTMRLHGPWQGWRMSGSYLIAPNKAGKITPQLLGAQLFLQTQREKLHAIAKRKPVLTSDTPP